MLEKLEATLVSRPRPYLRIIIHEGDDEAAAMEKALAEHVAGHPEDAGRTVKDFGWRSLYEDQNRGSRGLCPWSKWARSRRGNEVDH